MYRPSFIICLNNSTTLQVSQCYGTTYKNFCLHALGIPIDDSDTRLFRKPTPELLQQLSNGTGIAIELFEQMTLRCIWSRLIVEMTQYTETLEGQAQLALWRTMQR